MDLVIDANVLFSVLIKIGKTEELMLHEDIQVFAPEFIFEEFDKYTQLIIAKTERSKEELEEILDVLKKKIKTIPNEETEKFIPDAQKNIRIVNFAVVNYRKIYNPLAVLPCYGQDKLPK